MIKSMMVYQLALIFYKMKREGRKNGGRKNVKFFSTNACQEIVNLNQGSEV